MTTEFNKKRSTLPLYLRLTASIFLLFVLVFPGRAQQALIEARSAVDTSRITIGDRINYTISLEYQEGMRIERPGEGLNLGQFEIKSYEFKEPVHKNGRVIEEYHFTISVFDTGHYFIPPYPVAYFRSDTSRQFEVIEAPAIPIDVLSLLHGEEKPELKDVKPPQEIPFPWKFWIWMTVVAILTGLAAYLGFRLWQKHREKGYLFVPPKAERPIHEIIIEKMEALFASQLPEQGRFKEFYSTLSDLIREYLAGRYFFPALEMTTTEIAKILPGHLQQFDLQNFVLLFLQEADLVKFAKMEPEIVSANRHLQPARNLIEQTKLVFEPVTQETENK